MPELRPRRFDFPQSLSAAPPHREWRLQNKKRHVTSQRRPKLHKFFAGETKLPEPVESKKHGGGIGRAAAEAGRHGKPLTNPDSHAFFYRVFFLKEPRGAPSEV